MEIIAATEQHIPQLAPLFDSYRIFYGQESDLTAAARFLEARITKGESTLFLAYFDGQAVGFTQLYPSFSSVALLPIYILNDLYVASAFRKKGIGAALLDHAKQYCRQMGCKGLALETAIDNPAQKLYERLGWKKDVHCFHYFWTA